MNRSYSVEKKPWVFLKEEEHPPKRSTGTFLEMYTSILFKGMFPGVIKDLAMEYLYRKPLPFIEELESQLEKRKKEVKYEYEADKVSNTYLWDEVQQLIVHDSKGYTIFIDSSSYIDDYTRNVLIYDGFGNVNQYLPRIGGEWKAIGSEIE